MPSHPRSRNKAKSVAKAVSSRNNMSKKPWWAEWSLHLAAIIAHAVVAYFKK